MRLTGNISSFLVHGRNSCRNSSSIGPRHKSGTLLICTLIHFTWRGDAAASVMTALDNRVRVRVGDSFCSIPTGKGVTHSCFKLWRQKLLLAQTKLLAQTNKRSPSNKSWLKSQSQEHVRPPLFICVVSFDSKVREFQWWWRYYNNTWHKGLTVVKCPNV